MGRDRGGEDAALPHRGQLEVRLLARRILDGRDQRAEARGASGARRALSRPARRRPLRRQCRGITGNKEWLSTGRIWSDGHAGKDGFF